MDAGFFDGLLFVAWSHLAPLCTATEAPGGGLQTMTVLHWKLPGAKRSAYPELVGEGGRARLVVLAAEVGGRWSKETVTFFTALAKARAESSPFILQEGSKLR